MRTTPTPDSATSSSATFGSGAVAVGTVAAITAATGLPALCPFRLCTGMACPGCGMSRAAWRAVTGDLGGSWAMHPWLAPIAVQLAIVAVVVSRTGRRPPWLETLMAINGVALVIVWLLRWRLGLLQAVL